MWYGQPKRLRLKKDLTSYHPHLVRESIGTLVPGLKASEWGWQDRFGAVRFDCCGATIDVLLDRDVDIGTEEELNPALVAGEVEIEPVQAKVIPFKHTLDRAALKKITEEYAEKYLLTDKCRTIEKRSVVEYCADPKHPKTRTLLMTRNPSSIKHFYRQRVIFMSVEEVRRRMLEMSK